MSTFYLKNVPFAIIGPLDGAKSPLGITTRRSQMSGRDERNKKVVDKVGFKYPALFCPTERRKTASILLKCVANENKTTIQHPKRES